MIAVSNKKPTQNKKQTSKELPFSELSKLTDEELIEIVKDGHQSFISLFRAGAGDHARRAGAALVVLKQRQRHGTWTKWLKENFKGGSLETARLYIRIAKRWDEVEQYETLEKMRAFLAEPPSPPREVKLPYEGDEADEFDAMVGQLGPYFETAAPPDTVMLIVKRCHDELFRNA